MRRVRRVPDRRRRVLELGGPPLLGEPSYDTEGCGDEQHLDERPDHVAGGRQVGLSNVAGPGLDLHRRIQVDAGEDNA